MTIHSVSTGSLSHVCTRHAAAVVTQRYASPVRRPDHGDIAVPRRFTSTSDIEAS